jgi:hypothetical protein
LQGVFDLHTTEFNTQTWVQHYQVFVAVFNFLHTLNDKHEQFLNKSENLFNNQQFVGNETQTVQLVLKNVVFLLPKCTKTFL